MMAGPENDAGAGPRAGSPTAAGDPALQAYYRFHARIYDLTRWSFLFGRSRVLELAAGSVTPRRVLEIGCGTGRNLAALARRFPQAEITGVDLSAAMLARARRRVQPWSDRVQLRHQAYDAPLRASAGHDLIVASYALTMFNPGFEVALRAARADLVPGGHVAVVDFHSTRQRWFARWMRVNHVRMEGQLDPWLRQLFTPVASEVRPAYAGLWHYLLFLGRRDG